jgi:hypothetical protein
MEIKKTGLVKIGSIEFEGIEGGFGEGKKCILAKDIAKIHGKELYHINELINNNLDKFKKDIDIIDILGIGFDDTYLKELGFSQQALNSYKGLKAKGKITGIYLLSERGYAKLLKFMDDDLSYDLYEQLLDNYFRLRQEVKNIISNKDELLLNIIKSNGQTELAINLNKYEQEYVRPLENNLQETSNKLTYKQEVINGMTNNLKLQTQRQFLNDIIRMKGVDKIRDRWNMLYEFYNKTNHINIKARYEAYNLTNPGNKVKSVLEYVDMIENKIPELYKLAVKLFEADFKDKLQKYLDLI